MYVMCWLSDCKGNLVVLLLQVIGVYGHDILCTAQEEQPDIILARLPPRHDVSDLVDRCQVGARWSGYVVICRYLFKVAYLALVTFVSRLS